MASLTAPNPRIYLLVLGITLALAAALGAVSLVFLVRAKEIAPISTIVSLQQKTGAIYGPANGNAGSEYKAEIFRARKPEVIALGSSRAMRFRQAEFSAPFANLGGFISEPHDGLRTLAPLLSERRPKLILFTIDFWWFTPREEIGAAEGQLRTLPGDMPSPAGQFGRNAIKTPNLFLPLQWLIDGKLGLGDIRRIVSGTPKDRDIFPPRLGTLALKYAGGFGPDGSSYFDTAAVYGWQVSADRGFAHTFDLIARQRGGFECGSHVDENSWAEFVDLLNRLRVLGVTVITIVPPVATAILERMERAGSCYDYVTELRRRIPQASPLHFDFHDARPLGATDCEFFDGYHPGDVVYARMLRTMREKMPLVLDPVLNSGTIESMIESYQGRAFVNAGYGAARYREVDFLAIGVCSAKAKA